MSVINFWEIDLLVDLSDHYYEILDPIFRAEAKKDSKKVFEKRSRGLFIKEITESKLMESFDSVSLIEGLSMLSSYGLVRENQGLMNGTSYGPVTNFGRVFIDFVREE